MNTNFKIATDEYETDYIDLNGKRYCPYCGEEIKREEEYDHYRVFDKYICRCNDAQLAVRVRKEIKLLESTLPIAKYYKTEGIFKK